jgi:hypothetical protein
VSEAESPGRCERTKVGVREERMRRQRLSKIKVGEARRTRVRGEEGGATGEWNAKTRKAEV